MSAQRASRSFSRRRDRASAGPDRRAGGERHLPGIGADRLAALTLSRREIAVLELVAGGGTNEDVGKALGISPLTVKKHLERMMARLGVTNRTALVAAVWQRGPADTAR